MASWKEEISVGIVDYAITLRRKGAPSLIAALRAIQDDTERIICVQTGDTPQIRKPVRRAASVPHGQQRTAAMR